MIHKKRICIWLLVALVILTTIQSADGAKKKRIILKVPQRIKHVHHEHTKKIHLHVPKEVKQKKSKGWKGSSDGWEEENSDYGGYGGGGGGGGGGGWYPDEWKKPKTPRINVQKSKKGGGSYKVQVNHGHGKSTSWQSAGWGGGGGHEETAASSVWPEVQEHDSWHHPNVYSDYGSVDDQDFKPTEPIIIQLPPSKQRKQKGMFHSEKRPGRGAKGSYNENYAYRPNRGIRGYSDEYLYEDDERPSIRGQRDFFGQEYKPNHGVKSSFEDYRPPQEFKLNRGKVRPNYKEYYAEDLDYRPTDFRPSTSYRPGEYRPKKKYRPASSYEKQRELRGIGDYRYRYKDFIPSKPDYTRNQYQDEVYRGYRDITSNPYSVKAFNSPYNNFQFNDEHLETSATLLSPEQIEASLKNFQIEGIYQSDDLSAFTENDRQTTEQFQQGAAIPQGFQTVAPDIDDINDTRDSKKSETSYWYNRPQDGSSYKVQVNHFGKKVGKN